MSEELHRALDKTYDVAMATDTSRVLFYGAAREASRELAARDEEIARLKEALRPFARVAIFDIGFDEADKDLFRPMSAKTAEAPLLTVGDFRRARAALNGEKE